MVNPMLQVDTVHQVFRSGFWMKRVHVLKGVSLHVPKKSIFGFLGPNGAGKTTLIQLIVGIKRPVKGRVLVDGFDAQTTAARRKVGYLPERPYFHEHLTGADLLQYFGALSGMSRAEVRAKTPALLDLVGMARARDVELKNYSKGMLQRIGIAQAMLQDPEFLVLDEPMSGLDPIGRKEMREVILHLAGQGRTILFSTHVIPDVEAICDSVAIIKKGELVGCGPITQFLSKGPGEVEIAFSGLDRSRVEKIADFSQSRQIPEGFRAVIPSQEKVNGVLGDLLASGAKILWVNPIRPSLEDYFK